MASAPRPHRDFVKEMSTLTMTPASRQTPSTRQSQRGEVLKPSPTKRAPGKLFDGATKRIFDGESYVDITKEQLKEENKNKSKLLAGTFVSRVHKVETFSGTIPAVSPLKKEEKAKEKEPRNFLTNPPKKGGAGFVDTTFAKVTYTPDEFDAAREKEKKERAKEKELRKGPAFSISTKQATNTFDPNPFRTVDVKVKARKEPAEKKVVVPFRPSGASATRAIPGATSHLQTFTALTYSSEPYNDKKTDGKKKHAGPAFHTPVVSQDKTIRSVLAMNATRRR